MKRYATTTFALLLMTAGSAFAATSGWGQFDTGITQIVNLLQTDGAFVAIGLGVAGAVAGVVSRAGLHSVMEYAGIGVAAGALLASITTVGGLIGVGVLIG